MLEAFIITLREGVEAALVVGLLLATLAKTGRPDLKRPVLWGFAAAVLASIALGAVLRALDIDHENEALEGALFLVSAVMVASMAVWMWFHGRRLKKEIEEKVGAISAAPGAGRKFALFLFTFLMVGREGFEMVVFLAASTLSTQGVLTFVGGLAGIAVSVALGVAFVKGSLRINFRAFFNVTLVMLLVFAAQLLVSSFHEFVEAEVIKPSDPAKYMALVGPLVRNSAIFIIAVVLLPFALVAWHALRAPAPAAPAATPADDRKQRAMTSAERAWRIGFASLAIVAVVAIGGNHVYASRGLQLSPTTMLEPKDGVVRVATASLKEGEMGRYGVVSGDRVIRFLVFRGKDTPKTTFDACLLCADKGYVQQGEQLLCLNCLAEINALTLGLEGGCNPIPLPSRVEGGEVIVRVSDLDAKRGYFTDLPTCPHCKSCKIVRPGQKTCDMEACRKKGG